MKVLHLGVGNLFGGIESLLLTLARERHLCPEMEPAFTICFEGRLSRELRATGVPVHDLGAVRYSRPWTIWATRSRLRRLLQSERFDAVVDHGCWTRGLYGRTIRRFGLPVAFWLHNPAEGTHWLERKATKYPPAIVMANSRFTATSVGRLFPGVPTTVVYPPVSPPRRSGRSREAVRRELGTSEGDFVFVIVCRLEAWKGHRLLIDALTQMKEMPGWGCWVVGGAQRTNEQEYLESLQVAAERGGIGKRIRWLGQREDVPDLFNAADLHCQPNLGPEPFGIAFVEALYCGLPVVTTQLGALPEILSDGCGQLVPPNDPSALGTALIDWMRRPVSDREIRRDRATELSDPARQLVAIRRAIEAMSHSERFDLLLA